MLDKYSINSSQKRKTPCTRDNDISENKKPKNPYDKTIHKSAILSQINLSKWTRPEISFVVNKLLGKMNNQHFQTGTKL